MNTLERNLNALLILILSAILFGAFGVQTFENETPCPLCYLQRLGMIGVAIGALLNMRFGIRKMHYGISLLSAVFGGFVALRQIALHVCPGDPTFGLPFWGYNLYTWSFITFASCFAYIALLMLIFDNPVSDKKPQKMNWWCQLAAYTIFAAGIGNIISTLYTCGFGPCTG